MSKQEFSRLDVLLRVQSGRLRVSDACVLIGLQRRQVFRLLRGLKQDGATSLLSKRRGKPSNHRLPAEVRTLALSIVRERYTVFGLAFFWRPNCDWAEPVYRDSRKGRGRRRNLQGADGTQPGEFGARGAADYSAALGFGSLATP